MAVDVLTFGCRVNLQEGEAVQRLAADAGLDGLTVVNTCAVTAEAVRQARQAIRKARRARPDAPVVVTGCAAQIDPDSFAAMPDVARVLGNADKLDPGAWQAAAAALRARTAGLDATRKIAVSDIMAMQGMPAQPGERAVRQVRAFVQVQNGCDHRCTFCVIPFGRGNSRSIPIEDVVAQVRPLVEGGVGEVVLTGVDITSYGADLPGAPTLGRLVRAILTALPELPRLRLSSIDSVEADRDLLDALAEEPRLMPHLHLSLQAGHDLILKRMKRRHSRADAIAFCAVVRRLRPDTVFGADLIAGFPTETEAMFARSLDLVDDCGLTQLHVFPFSPRPGTPAARMPPVERRIVKERAARLRAHGDTARLRHFDGEIGQRRRILVENAVSGRTEQFTPVRLAAPAARGAFLDRTIAGHDGRVLLA